MNEDRILLASPHMSAEDMRKNLLKKHLLQIGLLL